LPAVLTRFAPERTRAPGKPQEFRESTAAPSVINRMMRFMGRKDGHPTSGVKPQVEGWQAADPVISLRKLEKEGQFVAVVGEMGRRDMEKTCGLSRVDGKTIQGICFLVGRDALGLERENHDATGLEIR